jgi:Ca2+/H+ antiporter, TMEM165/GDT1 family
VSIDAATLGLAVAVCLASAVEFVEAFTIVLAMGVTRGWRATIIGTVLALLALGAVVAVAGVALVTLVSESLLQLIIGTLLLIFGLQWLRKAILRSSGLKALHDEEETFREEQELARRAGHETRLGLDWTAFVVSFKGVFLEGLEVVFIVITFGLAASKENPNGMLIAAAGAFVTGVVVLIIGVLVHRPLSAVPENTMKYAVGLLLSTFGLFWAVEGLGFFDPAMRAAGESLEWAGGTWALLAVLASWFLLSRLAVAGLRRLPASRRVLAERAGAATGAPITPSAAG